MGVNLKSYNFKISTTWQDMPSEYGHVKISHRDTVKKVIHVADIQFNQLTSSICTDRLSFFQILWNLTIGYVFKQYAYIAVSVTDTSDYEKVFFVYAKYVTSLKFEEKEDVSATLGVDILEIHSADTFDKQVQLIQKIVYSYSSSELYSVYSLRRMIAEIKMRISKLETENFHDSADLLRRVLQRFEMTMIPGFYFGLARLLDSESFFVFEFKDFLNDLFKIDVEKNLLELVSRMKAISKNEDEQLKHLNLFQKDVLKFVYEKYMRLDSKNLFSSYGIKESEIDSADSFDEAYMLILKIKDVKGSSNFGHIFYLKSLAQKLDCQADSFNTLSCFYLKKLLKTFNEGMIAGLGISLSDAYKMRYDLPSLKQYLCQMCGIDETKHVLDIDSLLSKFVLSPQFVQFPEVAKMIFKDLKKAFFDRTSSEQNEEYRKRNPDPQENQSRHKYSHFGASAGAGGYSQYGYTEYSYQSSSSYYTSAAGGGGSRWSGYSSSSKQSVYTGAAGTQAFSQEDKIELLNNVSEKACFAVKENEKLAARQLLIQSLALNDDATEEAIKKAYFNKMRLVHPDKCLGDHQEDYTQASKVLNHLWTIFSR